MYILDVTTMANYMGRMTGITRVEHQLATTFQKMHPGKVRFVYWSNDKNNFEEFQGDVDFPNVKAAKQALDYSVSKDTFFKKTFPDIPELADGAFIVTGSGWLQNTQYAAGCIAFARNLGVRLVFYIHDLIPQKFPYFYDETYVRRFLDSLTLIASSGGLLLCNSENTRKDLLEWCAANKIDAPRTVIAYLGDEVQPEDVPIDPEDSLAEENYALAVGAIHRRKNYELLAATWRRLVSRMGGRTPKLKVVGGVTADGKALYEEIRQDPVLRGRVEILTGVDDSMLDRLYRHSKLVVYPSRYEGWGLPVAEALAYGKICLASNVSAIPEIADLGDDFLSPDDPVSWASRIMFYCQNDPLRAEREKEIKALYKPREWKDTVDTICKAVQESDTAPAPMLYPGEMIRINNSSGLNYIASQLYNRERWGVWGCGTSLKIRFSLPDLPESDLVARLGLAFREEIPFQITINGQTVDRRVSSMIGKSYHVTLPADLLDLENVIEISASGLQALPDENARANRRRFTGIGIGEFGIFQPEQLIEDMDLIAPPYPELVGSRFGRSFDFSVKTGKQDGRELISEGKTVLLEHMRSIPPKEKIDIAAFLTVTSENPVVVIARQNGKIVCNKTVTPDKNGSVATVFQAGGNDLDNMTLELFVMDTQTTTLQDFKVNSIYLPSFMFDATKARQNSAGLECRKYLKFGKPLDPRQSSIARSGWNTSVTFGVTVANTAILTLKVAGAKTVEKLKLKCKSLSPTDGIKASVLINGQSYDMNVSEELKDQFFDLPSKFYPGDELSICLTVESKDETITLRGLQLL